MKYVLFALLMIALLVGCSTQVEVPQEPDTPPTEQVDDTMNSPSEPAVEEPGAQEASKDELLDQGTQEGSMPVEEESVQGDDLVAEDGVDQSTNDTIDIIKAEDHVIVFEENFVVEPKELTIKVGETVTWRNNAKNFLHTPAWAHMSEKSKPLRYGEEWSYTFTEPGEIKWFSTAKPTAQGVIYVEE
ncbi:hypothetical protein D6774_00645 [Candidatus Woesearchaeota archaeon]|nr:MAG: hypothetical protein D6774_00645 [Candidatus Woesearchaeota archaeon]